MNKKIKEVLQVLRQWGATQITMTIERKEKSYGAFNILIFLTAYRLKAIEIAQLYKAIAKTGKPLVEIQVNEPPDENSNKSRSNTKNKNT